MATTPVPTPGAQEPTTPPAAAPVAQPAPAVPGDSRDVVIAKYQQMYGAPPEQPPVAPEPAAAPAAPAAPDPAIAQLQEQIARMQEELHAARQSAQPAPAAPAAAPMTPEEQTDWIAAIREGNFEEAKRLAAEAAKRAMLPELDRMRESAISESLAMMELNQRLRTFVGEVKSANPDLLEFEPYMQPRIQAGIEAALQRNPNMTPDDYEKTYRQVVNAEVEAARKLVQNLRAVGRQDAMTLQRDVLRTTVIPPSPVNPNTPGEKAPAAPEQPESASDYIRKRQQLAAQRSGMTI